MEMGKKTQGSSQRFAQLSMTKNDTIMVLLSNVKNCVFILLLFYSTYVIVSINL
jgi:hypothetical protein